MVEKPARLIVALIAGFVCAAVTFFQAGSSVLMSREPLLAAKLLPLNGLALEQAATRIFMQEVQTGADIPAAADFALPFARRAFAYDPLTPKAMAIIALAKKNRRAKNALLDKATDLNRRDLLLQGFLLEERVAARDYVGTLETLDQILRVHPEQQDTFFPILTEALKDEAAVSELGAVLDLNATWHERFLESAALDQEALVNLARLRLTRGSTNLKTDQRLIWGLTRRDEIALAYQVYLKARDGQPETISLDSNSIMAWETMYAPLDWRLAKEAGFRAQLTLDGNDLDVYIRSGKGGVLAERLVKTPSSPFSVAITHSLTPAAQVEDVRLQVGCPGDEEPLVNQPLSARPNLIAIPTMAGRCEFMKIALYGRSWSGQSAIGGQIAPLQIRLDR